MWPGFDFRSRSRMWAGFGTLPCSEGFFSGSSCFPSPQKPTFDLIYLNLYLSRRRATANKSLFLFTGESNGFRNSSNWSLRFLNLRHRLCQVDVSWARRPLISGVDRLQKNRILKFLKRSLKNRVFFKSKNFLASVHWGIHLRKKIRNGHI